MFQKETFQYERLEDVLGDRFGRYSKAIIQERAIPDVRDGLKPVQRRILYAMNHMKITSTSQYKKSARVCGEVMGKYHPHGDSSIYEAMVRMSQSWRMSVPLIDMQGNNGSIDGDGPAAMRYTESRLSKNADYLLEDIDKIRFHLLITLMVKKKNQPFYQLSFLTFLLMVQLVFLQVMQPIFQLII